MKQNQLRDVFRTVFAALILLPALAWGQAGTVIMARGEVQAVGNQGQERTLDKGSAVREGDHVLTGEESRAQLRLSDGALISLRGNSDYQIQVQDKGLMEQAGKLFQGWMRSVSGSIGRDNPDNVNQETPVATIGIRGTTFQMIHIPEGGLPGYDADPGTHIYLEQGRLKSTAGGDTRFMEPGDVIFIAPDGSGPKPQPGNRSLFVSGSDGGEQQDEPDRASSTTLSDDIADDDADILNRSFQDSVESEFIGETVPFMFPFAVGDTRATVDSQTTHMTGLDWLYQPGGGFRGFVGISGFSTNETFASGNLNFFEVQATGSTPLDSNQVQLLNQTNVYWGVWGKNDFEVVSNNLDGSIEGPWVYMYGLDPLQPGSADLPETGTFTYSYAGGTDLYTTGSVDPKLQINGGQLEANFDTSQITVNNLDVENIGSGAVTTYTGAASISDFYNGSLSLDGDDPNNLHSGNMGGEFVGNNAGIRPDGIISDVSICESCAGTPASGTAVFEGPPQ